MVTQVRPSKATTIVEYVDLAGRRPFGKWFGRLDAVAAARVTAALVRLSQGSWAQVKLVGAGVHELRVEFGPGYRVYLGTDGPNIVILLAGGTKSGQQQDIARAKATWAAYKRRRQSGDVQWH